MFSDTGLGSSSAFTVGLIKALYEFKNINILTAKLQNLHVKLKLIN